MKKIFTLLSAIAIGTAGFGQVVFESDLQSWTAGQPDGWMGTATHTVDLTVTEVPFGGTYSASMAQLITTGTAHRRFSTQPVTVVPGTSYEVRIWCTGAQGDLRTGYYYNNGSPIYLAYNPYVDVYAVTGGNLGLITQTIDVPASATTSGEFIISVLETDGTVGIVIDSVTIVAAGTTPPPTVTSIYDIQYSTTGPDYISPENGNVVTTRGIVTGVFAFGAETGNFFIQDGTGPFSGLYIYENGTTVALGDSVEVTGTIQEFFTLTEMGNVTNVTVLSSGHPQPAATVVSTLDAADEEYESVLVQVTDAICDDDDAGFGQFIVDDGSGDRLVDDQIYQYIPTLGNGYDVTGVTFLSFSEVKIMPRMASDITTVGTAGIEEDSMFSIYPNPATGVVFMNVAPDAMVRIYTMTGAVVFEGNVKNSVDVSAFDAGIYQVTVTTGETVSAQKLVIR